MGTRLTLVSTDRAELRYHAATMVDRIHDHSNTASLRLMVARACQLACRYCRMDLGGGASMAPELMEGAIDWLLGCESSSVELQLFGGEPLLRPELVRHAVRYANEAGERAGKSVTIVLSTNGLALDPSMLEFLAEQGVKVQLSLDGVPAAQSHSRPPRDGVGKTHPYAAPGLLRGAGVDHFVNMVVMPEWVTSIPGSVAYLLELGVTEIRIAAAQGMLWPEDEGLRFGRGLIEAFDLARQLRAEGSPVNILNLSDDAEPMLTSPQIAIDIDGTVYVGCSLVVENVLPDLHVLLRVGALESIEGIESLRRSREEQLALVESGLKDSEDWPIVSNNIAMGTRIGKLIAKYRATVDD